MPINMHPYCRRRRVKRSQRRVGQRMSHPTIAGGGWLLERRGSSVRQTTCHTHCALEFGFKRYQALQLSVIHLRQAHSNKHCYFQRRIDLELRATCGQKHPPRFRMMTRSEYVSGDMLSTAHMAYVGYDGGDNGAGTTSLPVHKRRKNDM